MTLNQYHTGDFLTNQLPDKAAKLIIADPPYFEVKGEFDFAWESFDHYLADVEKWARECKRLLADNGTLFWWGNSKKIAYSQIILDRYFNLENSLLWRKIDSMQYQYYSPDAARVFCTHNERLLMYSNEKDGHEEAELNNSYKLGTLHTEIMEELVAYFIGEMIAAGLTCAKINQLTRTKMASHWFSRSSQWMLPTRDYYAILQSIFGPQHLTRDFDELRGVYDRLRVKYDDLRRYFFNPGKLEEVLEFSQESHKSKKYKHDTIKPEGLTTALIQVTTKPGDLVFIPFGGSGTEGAVAVKENRPFIGYDINPTHVADANKRVKIAQQQQTLIL